MSVKLKKISATIAAAFMICGGIFQSSKAFKASALYSSTYHIAHNNYTGYPPMPGVPAYAVPVTPLGVAAYKVPVTPLGVPMTMPVVAINEPGAISLPRSYTHHHKYIICQGSRCYFVVRNNIICYHFKDPHDNIDRFFPVNWI